MGSLRKAAAARSTRLALILVIAAGPMVACSGEPDRSVESFCSTMRSEKARILEQLEGVQAAAESSDDEFAGVLLGLGGSMQALGELRTYFAKLSDVAPDEIRVEVEIVAEAMDKQLDAAGDAVGDPLGGLGSALMTSLTTSGQLAAVDEFARSNCGEGI
jgi:hypothetical protein